MTDKLYELILNQLEEIKETLKSIDERLRNVEIDIAEIKGRRLAVKDWLIIAIAVGALVVSIITMVQK